MSEKSAKASERSADAAYKGIQAQLVSAMRDAYASEEMLESMDRLRDLKRTHGENFKEEYRRLRNESDELLQARADQYTRDIRRVSHYFQKVCKLYTLELIDKATAMEVAGKDEVEFFQDIIEPLESVRRAGYERKWFDTLTALHGIPRRMPR